MDIYLNAFVVFLISVAAVNAAIGSYKIDQMNKKFDAMKKQIEELKGEKQ